MIQPKEYITSPEGDIFLFVPQQFFESLDKPLIDFTSSLDGSVMMTAVDGEAHYE